MGTKIKKNKIDAEEFAKYVNLNIGCGKHHLDDYINLDISKYCRPDLQLDIRDGLPFEKNRFKEVLANGVLEMILPNEEFLSVMNDIHRVLEVGGLFVGQVPSTDPRVVGLDPFDRRWFMTETFNYWNVDEHSYKEFGTQYGFKPWHVHKVEINDNGIINFQMSPEK